MTVFKIPSNMTGMGLGKGQRVKDKEKII